MRPNITEFNNTPVEILMFSFPEMLLNVSFVFVCGRDELTHCGTVAQYGDKNPNIDSGNGLLSDVTKPLPEPMMTDHQ